MALDWTRVTPPAPRYLCGDEEEEEGSGRVWRNDDNSLDEGTSTVQSQCGPPLNWKNTE